MFRNIFNNIKIFIILLLIIIIPLHSYSLSKKNKKQIQIEEQNKLQFNNAYNELINKYDNIINLTDSNNALLFARAYNNPEENPNIKNSTAPSENEFEYQKDKDIFIKVRSYKYAIIHFELESYDLKPYDFNNKCFTVSFNNYEISSPEGNVIYTKKRPPYIEMTIKNNTKMLLNIEPELAEQLKKGMTNTNEGFARQYEKEQCKDRVQVYVVYKIIGKNINENDMQHIEVEIVDYLFYWFIDAGINFEPKPFSDIEPCKDPIKCSTEIKSFIKK